MFTGIIESLGTVVSISFNGTNKEFTISSPISNELKVDQSLSHNGVCLTVTAIEDGHHQVTAIDETLQRSNLDSLKIGEKVNLERAMSGLSRFDGHLVQGHVDTVGAVVSENDINGSWPHINIQSYLISISLPIHCIILLFSNIFVSIYIIFILRSSYKNSFE